MANQAANAAAARLLALRDDAIRAAPAPAEGGRPAREARRYNLFPNVKKMCYINGYRPSRIPKDLAT